jgi:hypothetical protein
VVLIAGDAVITIATVTDLVLSATEVAVRWSVTVAARGAGGAL